MQWDRTYGTSGDEWCYSVIQKDDEGYTLAGSSADDHYYLITTDLHGNVQYSGKYASATGPAYCVIQTNDGGFLLGGYNFSLVKTDRYCNVVWSTTFYSQYTNRNECNSIVQRPDGGYAFGGSINNGTGIISVLLETDSSGHQLWNRTYPTHSSWQWVSIIQTRDGGFTTAVSQTHDYLTYCLFRADLEQGLAWTTSDTNSTTLYRGATDPYWNFVRVRIWAPQTP